MISNKILVISWIILSSSVFALDSGNINKIPFLKALNNASIEVDNLNDILNNALLIGNGDINALIYSDSNSILLNLTKNDVWDARVETINDPPIPTLDLIKQLGKSNTAFPIKNNNSGYVLPEGMEWNKKDSYHLAAYPCPRQCAKIKISKREKNIEYRGKISLLNAIAEITENETAIEAIKIRALSNRNIFLIETTEEVTLESIRSSDLPNASGGIRQNTKWIKQVIPGDLDWSGMEFAVAVASSENRKVVAIVSSMESTDVVGDAVKLADEILEETLTDLIKEHELTWNYFWSKSGIEMDDKFLESTWYRSLYFLRCVSKPGVQSVGLFAGLINDVPAWHGDYHTNYNIQQTYWSAYASNHSDLAEPYDRLIYEYLPRANWLSNKVYSMKGAYYPHVMYAYEPAEPDKCKSNNNRQYIHHTWGMTLGVNGFSVQPLWWRYKYNPDPERLKNLVYPVIRDVAIFYSEFIEQCSGGTTVRLGPSVSPEHWGWTKNLDKNYNCTFDIALIRYTLNAAIEGATLLKIDTSLVSRFQSALNQLPEYPLSKDQKPIIVDVEGAPPIEYNIPVPTSPIFPGDVVSWWSSNDEKQIFKRTIESLKWNGNNATFMLAIARARLSMPGSQEWLKSEIETRTRTNETISLNALVPHRRFNDFGHYTEQFGVGMAISELLLQSVSDIIRIFPAISPGSNIEFSNLRTQGGFLVTAKGSLDNVESLKIESPYGGELKLLSPWQQIEGSSDRDDHYSVLDLDDKGVISIKTRVGETWHFRKL